MATVETGIANGVSFAIPVSTVAIVPLLRRLTGESIISDHGAGAPILGNDTSPSVTAPTGRPAESQASKPPTTSPAHAWSTRDAAR